MAIKEEEEIKKEFQLERVILFTDAVFAIILTIMVLDLKLPEGIKDVTNASLHGAYHELVLKFVVYVVTFALVARFWMVHLQLFRFLKDYDSTLLVFNLIFLFCVSLFPFAAPLMTGPKNFDVSQYSWALTLYIGIVYSVVFMQALIATYLLGKRGILVIDTPLLETSLKSKMQKINLVLVPLMILMVIGFNYYELPYNYGLYTVIGYGIIIGWLGKRYYPGEENRGPFVMRLYRSIKASRAPKKIAPVHVRKGRSTKSSH